MKLDKVVLQNFRCFGPEPHTVTFNPTLTAFIGGNGSGKTATLLALNRMFGAGSSRTVVREDFHVAAKDMFTAQDNRSLAVDYYFSFPELSIDGQRDPAVPAFFYHIATDDNGEVKCRLRLESTWIDDGSAEGQVDSKTIAIRNMAPSFSEQDVIDLRSPDRARIRMIYVPAIRDGASQIGSVLRSRVWRTMPWSDDLRELIGKATRDINKAFTAEPGVRLISEVATARWKELHSAGTYSTPRFTPLDSRFAEAVRQVRMLFYPDSEGRECGIDELSEGQRSLFHLAMTVAMLEVETNIVTKNNERFDLDKLGLPVLTLIGVEEPENSLAPFYLSRIVGQMLNMVTASRAQAIICSHSAAMLARITPEQVRYFRLDAKRQVAKVRPILLPAKSEDASKYVREAVRAFPELYFARFVVLGEGASEQIVIPRLAEVLGIEIDRSFVAVVPLGGRHVQHLWKLLTDLEIPHLTMLDLDLGRSGGGWGRVATACSELINTGVAALNLIPEAATEAEALKVLKDLPRRAADDDSFDAWLVKLRQFGIYFCKPLDLDMSMLTAYQSEYMTLEDGRPGPSASEAYEAVLGREGDATPYDDEVWAERFKWYRYLFLGRGKPDTHMRVLSGAEDKSLAANVPAELKAMLEHVAAALFGDPAERQAAASQDGAR